MTITEKHRGGRRSIDALTLSEKRTIGLLHDQLMQIAQNHGAEGELSLVETQTSKLTLPLKERLKNLFPGLRNIDVLFETNASPESEEQRQIVTEIEDTFPRFLNEKNIDYSIMGTRYFYCHIAEDYSGIIFPRFTIYRGVKKDIFDSWFVIKPPEGGRNINLFIARYGSSEFRSPSLVAEGTVYSYRIINSLSPQSYMQ